MVGYLPANSQSHEGQPHQKCAHVLKDGSRRQGERVLQEGTGSPFMVSPRVGGRFAPGAKGRRTRAFFTPPSRGKMRARIASPRLVRLCILRAEYEPPKRYEQGKHDGGRSPENHPLIRSRHRVDRFHSAVRLSRRRFITYQ
jgi:hypothetical protein